MINEFEVFAIAVRRRFNDMANHSLFMVDCDRDALYEKYLASFPEGSNPIFRERTEHDCSCCRNFIRNIGSVVTIENGTLTTIWDVSGLPTHYQVVADAMAAYVKALPICDVFVTSFSRHGTAQNQELINGTAHTWKHFSVDVPRSYVDAKPDERRGFAKTSFQVLRRGVTELTTDALNEVSDLIKQNALYRGAEFADQLKAFIRLHAQIKNREHLTESDILTLWKNVYSAAARFRNSVLGTLVTDLSNGVSLEDAVATYESKVAPQNYKRPKALITSRMVNEAMRTIEELELESALKRRHAKLSDISVTDVIFVNRDAQQKMQGGVRDLLMREVKPLLPDLEKAEAISIDDFISRVLPGATEMSVMLENKHFGNLMSVTAPVHEDSKPLFRWDNSLAWSYSGDVTDSIKQRVKRAGGRVENVFMRVSLGWYNLDDLDIHVYEPDGNHIYFGNKSDKLDVDMNVSPSTREAVENVRWVKRPKNGLYQIVVNNYTKRENVDVGFTVEIELDGAITTLSYDREVRAHENVSVANISLDGRRYEIIPHDHIIVGEKSNEKWSVKTQAMTRVSAMIVSPNYWKLNEIGNRHWFFILQGCLNPDPVRGIYNEFLKPEFARHRKVFEVLGAKTKCSPASEQMSGIGFSETKAGSIVVSVSGPQLRKTYRVMFAEGEKTA